MADFIVTSDTEGLRTAFEDVDKPKGEFLEAIVQAAQATANKAAPPVLELGQVGRWFRKWREERRLYAAAYYWIDPNSGNPDASRMTGIRVGSGLEYLSEAQVVTGLIRACEEISRKHPSLSRWIEARCAEADFCRQSGVDAALQAGEAVEVQQKLLTSASFVLGYSGTQEPMWRQAQQELERGVRASLNSAKAVIRAALDPELTPCSVSANLMMPLEVEDISQVAGRVGPLSGTKGFKEAAKLWAGLSEPVHRVHVLVAETSDSDYKGFWVPDARENGVAIPGAPEAFATRRAQAIFRDDLPKFPLRQEAKVEKRWRDYMTGNKPTDFLANMFVSIPILGTDATTKNRTPEGVLNVNVGPGRSWIRAYSPSWRNYVARLVAPTASCVLHAFTMVAIAERRRVNELGVSARYPSLQLPGSISDVTLALPERTNSDGDGS